MIDAALMDCSARSSTPSQQIGPNFGKGARKNPPGRRQEFRMRRLVSEFCADQSGATAIEYCLIATGIAFAIIAAVQGIGPTLSTKFTAVNNSLK
jgi:pilus assembly protein Flp/PilA